MTFRKLAAVAFMQMTAHVPWDDVFGRDSRGIAATPTTEYGSASGS